jgi:hypothetical protein
LPEIEGEYIVLLWDHDWATHEIIIRHGWKEIFRQEVSYEYYDFFIQACRVLKTKYGIRLLDVVPTPRAETYLWGDALSAPSYIDKMRELIGRDIYSDDFWRKGTEERRFEWKVYRNYFDK